MIQIEVVRLKKSHAMVFSQSPKVCWPGLDLYWKLDKKFSKIKNQDHSSRRRPEKFFENKAACIINEEIILNRKKENNEERNY